jgi:DNA repair exonuclease SbcCD nuclease subunit
MGIQGPAARAGRKGNPMFTFLHTADLHLDSPLKGLELQEDAPLAEIRGATRRAFTNLIDFAIAEEVAFVLIAGDLYDGDWKDYNTGLFFVRQMGRLEKAGIRVFIVSGNHDAASQITKTMPLPGNVTVFAAGRPQSVRLETYGVLIHGRSYASRAVSDNLAAGYPLRDPHFFNIGLLHTSLTGREGHENYAPCTLDDLRSKGYDYWALGHVHQREVVLGEPLVLFPGNIQGRHIKETGVKGATLVTVADGRIAGVAPQEFDVLRWAVCRADLSDCETREAVYACVRRAMEKEQDLASGRSLAIRLHLEGSCPLHRDLHARSPHWVEEFRGIAAGLGEVWLEKVKIRTRAKSDAEEPADSPLAGLLRAVDSLEAGDNALTTWVPELAGLKTKLPADLLGEDSILARSAGDLAELKDEVKELLIARLQGGAP